MSIKKEIVFVVNPISGTQNKKAILELIKVRLNNDLFNYQIATTNYPGHAAEIAQEAARQGKDIVVAIGGDGTVNEVARSLVHTNTALGIIPCGSGNGLARHLRIPIDPQKAIEIINKAKVKDIDYGKINGMPFFCTCGVGFDALVSFKFAEAGKRGLLTYLEKTLTEWIKYKPATYDLIIEDEDNNQVIQHKALLIACANASQYGNNAYIAPQASISDGIMDVTIMKPFTVFDAPQIAIQMFAKNIDKNSHIKTLRCKKLTIHRKEAGVVHYDGDPIMTGQDVSVELIQGGLKAVINEDAVYKQNTSAIQAFSEYFNALHNNLHGNIINRSKRALVINRNLLRKLTGDSRAFKNQDKNLL